MDYNFEHNLRYKDCLTKYVKVKTVDTREHEGWLKCIDPLTGNIFLITFDDTFTQVIDAVLIIGSTYSSIEVIRDADDKIKKIIEELFHANSISCIEDVIKRKERLLSWIKKHRLPVIENEDESLLVCDSVKVLPPYQIQNCSSLNGTVLKNVRQLIAKLPTEGFN